MVAQPSWQSRFMSALQLRLSICTAWEGEHPQGALSAQPVPQPTWPWARASAHGIDQPHGKDVRGVFQCTPCQGPVRAEALGLCDVPAANTL